MAESKEYLSPVNIMFHENFETQFPIVIWNNIHRYAIGRCIIGILYIGNIHILLKRIY